MGKLQAHGARSAQSRDDLTGTTIGRFVISARLGTGGMGEVYRAEDSLLKRPVALKRIAPQLRADENYHRRFLKEAERASSLNDPHIAAVYDVLEEKGETFLVMEYVEGQTLRRRLEGPLGVREFMTLAVQCTEALVAAQEKGIVHRDLKPENIMLTPKGQIKILDFGVAKRVPPPGGFTTVDLSPGTVDAFAGTPAYMAPEVLLGNEAAGRADIFSLGVVFYEALAGRHPFRGGTSPATSDRILHATPAPLTELDVQVPAGLERIVTRMLAKAPAERYATARDLRADLLGVQRKLIYGPMQAAQPAAHSKRRRAITGAALAVVVFLIGAALIPAVRQPVLRWLGIDAIPKQKNLVVLPFRAIGGGPEDQAYADGLTETVTANLTRLTRTRSLQVVPASEVRAQGVAALEDARKELGAHLALEATWQRAGDNVRINLVVTDARTARQLRAETITESAADVFKLQDSVVAGALFMLGVEVPPEETLGLVFHGTTVPAAYDLYLRGVGYLQRYERPENVDAAIALLQRALEEDADYALTHAALGEAYWKKYEGARGREWVEAARQACERALKLDPDLATPHICLGTVRNGTGEYMKAATELQRALEIDPTSDAAYRGLAQAYEKMDRAVDAERTYRRAIELRPRYWASYIWLGGFYARQARYPEAVEQFRQAETVAPENVQAIRGLGGAYILMGRYEEAIAALRRAVDLRPTFGASSNLGIAYLSLRRFEEAIAAFEQAAELGGLDYRVSGNLARAYYWAPGRRARGLEMYERAIRLGREQLEINPRDADAHVLLANYHAMLGQRPEALSHLQQALAEHPNDPEFLWQAALVHNQFGDLAQTLASLERAVGEGYSRAEIETAIELDELRDNPAFQALIGPT